MKNLQWAVFAAMVLAQLAVPFSMIATHEQTLSGGTAYKFRCGPVDPYDYFRGRYVALNFTGMSIDDWQGERFQHGDPAYATLGVDAEGFATLVDVTSTPPATGDYLAVTAYSGGGTNDRLWVTLPFTKYFMNEFDAPLAEQAYREQRQTSDRVYAVIRVQGGHGVIEGLYVDDMPMEEYILNDASTSDGAGEP